MGAILSFFRPAPVARGDWSQREIAEFYRVEAALTQAGLRITTDRGLTDEGDPWFVFCRFDGDVILHFARIDDLYVVASEAFERPLQGPDFRALLNAVASEHPTLVPIPRQNAQGKAGNLVLHPAALLAAIVATVAFQLAGGDAMAGELASEEPAAAMHQPGTEGHARDTNSVMPGPDPHPHSAHDELGRLTGEDEGRHARHALVLSAIALISTTLPADQAVDATGGILGESPAGGARSKAVPVTVVEVSQAAAEGRRSQGRDEAALDAGAEHAVAGGGALVQVSAVLTGTASGPAIFGNIDLVRLNVLGLGAAGGQEIAVMRAAESAPPMTAILVGRVAAHAVPVAVEKAAAAAAPVPAGGSAPMPSGGATPAPAAGSPAPSPATVVVGGTTAAPASAAAMTTFLAVGTVETGGGHSAAGGGASPSAPSQASVQGQAAAAGATASPPEKLSAPSAPTPATQFVAAAANLTVRTALNSFLEQYASATKLSALGSDTAATTKLGEMALTSLAKLIGTGAVSEFLSSFTAYGGSVTASKLVTASTSDPAIDPIKGVATSDGALGGTTPGTLLQGSAVLSGTAAQIGAVKDKDAAPSSEGATKITDKVVEAATKLAGAEVTKTGLGEGATGTVAKEPAPSSESATKITDKVVEAATKLPAVEVAKASLGEGATGTGAKDAAPLSEGATKITDKVVEAATKLAGTDVAKASPGEGAAGTAAKDAAPSSEGATKITDKVVEAATKHPGDTTLDTATLAHPAPMIAPQSLDEQGRQLIARFLESTTQVQTFVSERSFVMIGMDANHYGNPDFSVRTWSIGHDVAISIIGIAEDSPHNL
ncbi:hypothetical protein FV218_19070 [Methylobacterium sp. WL69]|uniref:hypothetical protein n=1 Tax=Methylobacterium sp. WL69 TaxID=2603893 RepID=UPI0011C7A83F|nr:hypothetical protein [Methylobacterium sp. WL69]TXM67707.1 hypothetical protein FV218_19070 [Methylobacterium sp. WL69]